MELFLANPVWHDICTLIDSLLAGVVEEYDNCEDIIELKCLQTKRALYKEIKEAPSLLMSNLAIEEYNEEIEHGPSEQE